MARVVTPVTRLGRTCDSENAYRYWVCHTCHTCHTCHGRLSIVVRGFLGAFMYGVLDFDACSEKPIKRKPPAWRPMMKKFSMLGIVVAAALLAAVPFSLQWSHEKVVALSLDSADARVGRPLTATSVAGVHRRAHRRAYRHGHYYYY